MNTCRWGEAATPTPMHALNRMESRVPWPFYVTKNRRCASGDPSKNLLLLSTDCGKRAQFHNTIRGGGWASSSFAGAAGAPRVSAASSTVQISSASDHGRSEVPSKATGALGR